MHEVFFCRWTGGPASRMQRSRVYRGSSAAQIAIKGIARTVAKMQMWLWGDGVGNAYRRALGG